MSHGRPAPRRDTRPTVGDLVLRAAAAIVPADRRAGWLREWRAELDHAVRTAARDGSLTPPRRAALRARAAGAFVHALWLRWDQWRIDTMWHDVQYAIRSLVRKPVFAAATILTLAIGIGANAAIFSAVRAVLLRPLPFPDPKAVVSISTTTIDRPDLVGGSSSPSDFVDWRREVGAFTEIAAINPSASALTGDGIAEQVPNGRVTGGFFDVLRVAPLHGRTLTPDDDAMTAPDVAVLSYRLWKRRFSGRADVVGGTATLDGRPTRIVGVMPATLDYPLGAEIWLPLRFSPDEIRTQRGAQYLDVIARLKPGGAGIDGAAAEMRGYSKRLGDTYPRTNADRTVAVFPLRDAVVGDARAGMLLIFGAVAFVLLIVCVNVASLVLTRALDRRRELAVRAALGADRARLVRGLLVESLVLGVSGGVMGLIVATWAARAIAALDSGIGIPLLNETRVDGPVLLFTMTVSLLSAILVGLIPAWQASSGVQLASGIREDSRTSTGDRGRQRLRSVLIVSETALAVALLVGAGLLMRSFVRTTAVDLGFVTERVQTFNLALPAASHPTPPVRAAFIETLTERLRTLPDVEAAGAVYGLPLTDFNYVISMSTLDGRRITDDAEQNQRSLEVRVVTPDYFQAMGIPIRRGRALAATDRLGAPPAVLVNDTAARMLWPGADPLGHEFTLGTRMGQGGLPAGGAVVGVAGDVRDFGPRRQVRPTVYLSHAQFPVSFMSVVIKARRDAGAAVKPARAVLDEINPNLPMYRVRTAEQLAANAIAQPRLYLMLMGLFAGAAVLLAAIGIYGVLAHSVSQRTREIGIRLALGASRRLVVRQVVGQAGRLAIVGLGIGLLLSMATGRFIQELLFGIEPVDTATYALVAAGLGAVSMAAAWLPARRAARVDPVIALRNE